ncbi:MAG: RES family NAD+ phosphorylase [Planctomycetes bacterium]|nr:RES family NAD+ phosphorylase [Planctomycetota bacterium]
MRCWRITSKKRSATAFDGEGARRVGGRWNSVGVPAIYVSEHLSTAVLEILVHADPSDLVAPFVTIELELPDDVLERVPAETLPSDWRDTPAPAACQTFGDAWLQAGTGLGLVVPSAVIPDCVNIIINPRHAAMSGMKVLRQMPFTFDPRLYSG